jgi:ABC-2 type transport system ATP-binding protein
MKLLEVDGVSKVYPNGVRANNEITLSAERGEVFGLLGPNGAGKTTLVGQILGLAKPTSGTIRIDGVDVVQRPAVARESCSYQPQSSVPIRGLTPSQAVALMGRIRGLGKAEARRRTGRLLDGLELTEWATRVVSELSGGVVRLVAFCMAAVAPGRIVILDEPTNDVDPLRRKLLWKEVRTLADAGSAVMLVTHNVLEAERCVDRLAIVDQGRVVGQGTPATMKRDLGGALRLEVVLDPTTPHPDAPAFLAQSVLVGRRLFGDVQPFDIQTAIAWARALQDRGAAEEFSIGPATLEDVYVRRVGPDAHRLEGAGAPTAR